LIKRKVCKAASGQLLSMRGKGKDLMSSIHCWKIFIGLALLATLAGATTAGAQTFPAHPAQSYCLISAGGMMNRCGFATFEQCKEYSANYGICNESLRAADRYWIDQTPYARMGKPRRH
jgi:hypothetical protein